MSKSNIKLSIYSVLVALAIGLGIILISGYNPVAAVQGLLSGMGLLPLNTVRIGQILYVSAPLIMAGLSVGIGLKSGLFNIGAEGQFLMGGIFGMVVAVNPAFASLPSFIHLLLILSVSAAAGAMWGLIPGILKAKFDVHEVVISIMANYIALYFVMIFFSEGWILTALTNPRATEAANVSFAIQPLVGLLGSRFGIQVIIAVLSVFAYGFLINKTKLGYEMRAVGANRNAAEYAGMKVKKNIIITFALAGALAGLAGIFYFLPLGTMNAPADFIYVGFDGIGVALLGGANAMGILIAGIFMGALKTAAASMQAMAGVPQQLVDVVMGLAILFIGASYFISQKFNINDEGGEE